MKRFHLSSRGRVAVVTLVPLLALGAFALPKSPLPELLVGKDEPLDLETTIPGVVKQTQFAVKIPADLDSPLLDLPALCTTLFFDRNAVPGLAPEGSPEAQRTGFYSARRGSYDPSDDAYGTLYCEFRNNRIDSHLYSSNERYYELLAVPYESLPEAPTLAEAGSLFIQGFNGIIESPRADDEYTTPMEEGAVYQDEFVVFPVSGIDSEVFLDETDRRLDAGCAAVGGNRSWQFSTWGEGMTWTPREEIGAPSTMTERRFIFEPFTRRVQAHSGAVLIRCSRTVRYPHDLSQLDLGRFWEDLRVGDVEVLDPLTHTAFTTLLWSEGRASE